MVWKAKLVFVLLRYNKFSYQIQFTKQNSPNQIYWTKVVSWGINLIYWNKFTNQIYKTESNPPSKMCEMWRTKYTAPNILNQIHSIKHTKLNPPNQFYQTNSSLTSLNNFMQQILNEVKQVTVWAELGPVQSQLVYPYYLYLCPCTSSRCSVHFYSERQHDSICGPVCLPVCLFQWASWEVSVAIWIFALVGEHC